MASRHRTLVLLPLLLAACQTTDPVVVQPSFQTLPAMSTHNPTDVAVLAFEDGTQDREVARLFEQMREALERQLVGRKYTPLNTAYVDARFDRRPEAGETVLSPAWLKKVAGSAKEDAVLVVRIDRWDDSSLLVDNKLRFQLEAAMAAADGQLLWHGSLSGAIKAGGVGAAPRDREAMARSCAELAMEELANHVPLHRLDSGAAPNR